MASRGKMAGRTFGDMANGREEKRKLPESHPLVPANLPSANYPPGHVAVSPFRSLTEPLVEDLSHASRKYLSYCEIASFSHLVWTLMLTHTSIVVASDVCKDFVLYDSSNHNHFRELIPLTRQYPVLFHIIIAISALHMWNASQNASIWDASAFSRRRQTDQLSSVCSSFPTVLQSESYHHALAAKQRALSLLKTAISNIASADLDVTLAVVLLFIEFELIDSGRDHWKYHIKGARTMIEKLAGINLMTQTAMSPLRRSLISNCLVYVGSNLVRA